MAERRGMWMPMSKEMADAASNYNLHDMVNDALTRYARMTPAQREHLRQEEAARAARFQREVTDLHRRHLDRLDGVLHELADLHGPVVSVGRAVCEGCDNGGYAVESPGWPCRTYALITGMETAR